jgi:hypothetical protein
MNCRITRATQLQTTSLTKRDNSSLREANKIHGGGLRTQSYDSGIISSDPNVFCLDNVHVSSRFYGLLHQTNFLY